MSLEKLVKRATYIDTIDLFTGPFSAYCNMLGTPGSIVLGGAVSLLEFGILKLPFIYSYAKHTKDYKSVALFSIKELTTLIVPPMNYADVIPLYSMRMKSALIR